MIALSPTKSHWGTLLALGRVSNLPTVWSNCLAGWLLAGGGSWERWDRFVLLLLGGTFLYLGGMYLNDAFDAQFDRQHRGERPIPSGAISATTVWQWGFSWLLLGCCSLLFLGKLTALLGILLALLILIYDAIHKIFAFSPVLMGACRMLLVLIAASVGADGVTGLSFWSALVLGSYTTGVTSLARREIADEQPRYWPALLLAPPVLLAVVVNPGEYKTLAYLLCGVFIIWVFRSLRIAYWSAHRNVGRTVSGLLAGIILVDVLAVGPDLTTPIIPFFSLFALALLFQRYVRAT